MTVLVTGAAGFIGFHTAKRLLDLNFTIIGIDNLNNYYDVNLKKSRLNVLKNYNNFIFLEMDVMDRLSIGDLFKKNHIQKVIHLAAQAGVRYSLIDPYTYVDSNLFGFLNILEGCRRGGIEHLVYASSSSVYGGNTMMPFSVHQNVDHPMSLYAATKKANELMAHSYANLFKIPCTGLRLFTVYGPWGRPDMSYFLFTKAILDGKPIQVFNHGKMKRDFTYIDDIVSGIAGILDKIPQPNLLWDGNKPDPATSSAPYKIYNLGNNKSVDLLHFIGLIEKELGKTVERVFLPLQAGDVPETWADIDELSREIGYKPSIPVEVGIPRFIEWYREYYGI